MGLKTSNDLVLGSCRDFWNDCHWYTNAKKRKINQVNYNLPFYYLLFSIQYFPKIVPWKLIFVMLVYFFAKVDFAYILLMQSKSFQCLESSRFDVIILDSTETHFISSMSCNLSPFKKCHHFFGNLKEDFFVWSHFLLFYPFIDVLCL